MIDLFVRKIFEQLEGKDHPVLLFFFSNFWLHSRDCAIWVPWSLDHQGVPCLTQVLSWWCLVTSSKNVCGMKELKKYRVPRNLAHQHTAEFYERAFLRTQGHNLPHPQFVRSLVRTPSGRRPDSKTGCHYSAEILFCRISPVLFNASPGPLQGQSI